MRHYVKNLLFLSLILCLLVGIIKYPEISIDSAYDGLLTWFNIVLPSLFPFFIISEILIEIGFVSFTGKCLQPIMSPMFNVSGEGAFPFSMSIISGYPIGAKVASSLREKGIITKTEAERVVCFSSTSGPLFMLGAVAIGMLNNSSAAPLIMYPHYLGAVTIGIFLRFYKHNEKPSNRKKGHNIRSMVNDLNKNYSIGSILSNAVKNSLSTIILVGGFIIFYSVLTELLFTSKIFNKLIYLIDSVSPFRINKELLHGFIAGFLEVTTGCKKIASLNIDFIYKILIINFLIGWSGFSIHSQSFSFISKTDINSKVYILSKFLHGILSSFYTLIIYNIKYKGLTEPSFMPGPYIPEYFYSGEWTIIFTNSLKLAILATLYLLICSLIMLIIYKISQRN